jgi:glycosyltransferase involved in cell wall biosynthesis
MNLYGPINQLGMGIHFVNWAAALIQLLKADGHYVFVCPKGPIGINRQNPSAAERNVLGCLDNKNFDAHSSSISLWHLSQVADFTGSLRTIYTVFETDRLRPEEEANLWNVDRIMVPTKWHRDILDYTYSVEADRILVVPEGIGPDVFNITGGVGQSWVMAGPADEIRFLSVGKLEKRKGIEPMIDALVAASIKTPRPIRLIAHWHNPFIQDWFGQASNLLQARGLERLTPTNPNLPIVQFTTTNLTIDLIVSPLNNHHELASLYHSAHWMLYPSFAEGWGLPLHEALACGVPAIAQNYSGMSEYLPEGGYLPVDGQLVTAKDKYFFHGNQGRWKQVNTDSLIHCIGQAINISIPDYLKMSGAAGTAGKFTWQHAAEKTMELLNAGRL